VTPIFEEFKFIAEPIIAIYIQLNGCIVVLCLREDQHTIRPFSCMHIRSGKRCRVRSPIFPFARIPVRAVPVRPGVLYILGTGMGMVVVLVRVWFLVFDNTDNMS
jgi:hypothetical protein